MTLQVMYGAKGRCFFHGWKEKDPDCKFPRLHPGNGLEQFFDGWVKHHGLSKLRSSLVGPMKRGKLKKIMNKTRKGLADAGYNNTVWSELAEVTNVGKDFRLAGRSGGVPH